MKVTTLGLGWALALLTAAAAAATDFNPELRERTGLNGNPPWNVYTCKLCTFEQFLAVPLPDELTNVPPVPVPGTALSLDLVPEIEGDDHVLVAQVLLGRPLGFGEQGLIAWAQVARGTTMRFKAGRVIQLLMSPQGAEYVLFSMNEIHTSTFDPFVLDGMAAMSIPSGWSYSSEMLSSDLVLGTSDGIARVYSVPEYWSFQEVVVVPEPGATLLSGVALLAALGLAGVRRRPLI